MAHDPLGRGRPDVSAGASDGRAPGGKKRPRWAFAGALAAIAFAASACGGGVTPSSVAHLGKSVPTTAPTAAGSGGLPNLQQMYEAGIAYAGCMRSHGVANFPDPVLVNNSHQRGIEMGQGVNLDAPQARSANNACKHLLPNDGNGPTQAQLQQMMARALKYSECMRTHGLPNFPDPTQSANGISLRIGGPGLDPNSAQFQAAQRACRPLAPGS